MRIRAFLSTTELRRYQLKTKVLMLALLCGGYAHAQLMSSSNPALEGQPVTFTAQIEAPSGVMATPSGTVLFTDNDQNIGTAPVQNGVALFTAQFTGTGDHVIVAQYSGDANFSPSSSPPFTEHITADDVFTLSVSPSLITQHAGTRSSLTVTLLSNGSVATPVHLGCEDLPPGVTCSFQTNDLVPTTDGIATTATITSAGANRARNMWIHSPVLCAGFFIPVLFYRRRYRRWLLPICGLALVSIAGCGGKVRVLQGGTPAGSYVIHITGSDGTHTQQAAIKLSVT